MDFDLSNPKYGKSVEDYLNSVFFKRKAKTYFNAMDVIEDGFLTKEDYNAVAENFIANQGDDQKNYIIKEVFSNLFKNLVAHKSESEEPKVSFQEFFENISEAFVSKEMASQGIRETAEVLFDFIDTSNDQVISAEEYKKYLTVKFGTKISDLSEVSRIAFESIDTQNNGTISRDQFVKAHLDYSFECFGNEATSVLLYGPLLEI